MNGRVKNIVSGVLAINFLVVSNYYPEAIHEHIEINHYQQYDFRVLYVSGVNGSSVVGISAQNFGAPHFTVNI